jgi:diaminopimelate decarboxylase
MDDSFLLKVAQKFGTPAYVYDEGAIRKNYRTMVSAFRQRYKSSRVFYALKANPSLAICHILRQEGAGIDVVSEGELATALKAGVKPKSIIFSNNSKTDAELAAAVDAGVTINVDSVSELRRLSDIARRRRKDAHISFRVNPAIDAKTNPKIATGLRETKFGVHLEGGLALAAYAEAKKLPRIEPEGVHAHIGSQITDVGVFGEAARKLMDFSVELKEKLGLKLKFVDFGGGLGISYTGDPVPTAEEYAEAITSVVKEYAPKLGYEPELWVEPGRYIVGDAGVLLCSVTCVKETPYRKFVNLNTGFNALIRPAMYDAYHQVKVLNRVGETASETYDVVGNICESGDVFAKDRKLPKTAEGDIVAIYDTGAYGFSMSSQYNQRPRPMEILAWGETVEVIREKERFDDLFRHQKIPKDLLD